jgi:hypothetical protein
VALSVYFDGSWNDESPSVMAVGGFLSSEGLWLWIEDKWAELLSDFGLNYFQMRQFTTFSGQFKGWEDRESDRREFVRRATDLIGQTAMQSFSATILMKDWEFCNQGYALDDSRFYPYSLCGWACIQHVRVWCQNQKPPRPLGRVLYFFEKGDPNQDDLRKRADRDFGIEIQTPKAIPDDPSVRPLGALQVADFAIWNVRNLIRDQAAGELTRYRKDFELLFSRVPTYPHHVHFSMDIHPRRLPDDPLELVSIRNEVESEEASLVRFCQDANIPLRPGMSLWKKKSP